MLQRYLHLPVLTTRLLHAFLLSQISAEHIVFFCIIIDVVKITFSVSVAVKEWWIFVFKPQGLRSILAHLRHL